MAVVSWAELIASRLEATQKPFQDELEVCCCPRHNGLLIYDPSTQKYIGRRSCETEKICAILMIAKHRALLSGRISKKRTLRVTTLDKYF